jgi:hypothetical protein
MLRSARFVVGVLFVSLLAACVGPVAKIDTKQEAVSRVRSIAVIRPPEVKTFTVMNFGHPGMAFGLVGGLVAAADQSAKQDKITAALKGRSIVVSSRLADDIARGLAQKGFQVKVEEAAHSDADAVLVVAPTIVGFIATGVTSDYMPTMTTVVSLLGKDRKEMLYRGFHASGWQPKGDGWRHTPATRTFGNFEDLTADPGATGASLYDAADSIASTVVSDIRQ